MPLCQRYFIHHDFLHFIIFLWFYWPFFVCNLLKFYVTLTCLCHLHFGEINSRTKRWWLSNLSHGTIIHTREQNMKCHKCYQAMLICSSIDNMNSQYMHGEFQYKYSVCVNSISVLMVLLLSSPCFGLNKCLACMPVSFKEVVFSLSLFSLAVSYCPVQTTQPIYEAFDHDFSAGAKGILLLHLCFSCVYSVILVKLTII
ncbi:hypothetical protein Ancab_005919 [Ancistrocladus abbreviatus]